MCPCKQLIACPQIQLFAIMIGIWDPDNATFPCPDLFKQYGRPKGTPASPKQPSKTLHKVVPELLILALQTFGPCGTGKSAKAC